MAVTGTTRYVDTIGFRRLDGRDLGLAQGLPHTAAAACWVAGRYAATRAALGRAFLLQLPAAAFAAPLTEWDAATFLSAVAALCDCQFVIEVGEFSRYAAMAGTDPAAMAQRLPRGRIATIALSGEREAEWALLSILLAETGASAVVLRRHRNLFPLDRLAEDARRAAELLAAANRPTPMRSAAPGPCGDDDPAGLAVLRAYQTEIVASCTMPDPGSPRPALGDRDEAMLATRMSSVQFSRTWRERVEETHKARQIMEFLAEDRQRREPRRG
jgi:hypothetical protein